MNWLGSLVSFGGSVIVAIITALLAVRLVLKRFYAAKWWERQIATYESMFEALHHVRNHADNYHEEDLGSHAPNHHAKLCGGNVNDC
jgi:hypothetical protein